ncbi:tRNA (guanosine(18)-2'-O)-methyltransferase TARBP1 isoform X2 [Dermacentor variabilis]|uniref:tRNA (guanosine(18)-2'-O)-methyltransferase TARBP1 isoform X2 n=1 Tax=Dermacentor variabilis TaxID=34621 RepID=UPI003F5C017B
MELEDFALISVGCCGDNADGALSLLEKLASCWRSSICGPGCGGDSATCWPDDSVTRTTRLVLQDACLRDEGGLLDAQGPYAASLRRLVRAVTPAVSALLCDRRSNLSPQRQAFSTSLSDIVSHLLECASRLGEDELKAACDGVAGPAETFLTAALSDILDPSLPLLNLCFKCCQALVRIGSRGGRLESLSELMLDALKVGKPAIVSHVIARYVPELAVFQKDELRSFVRRALEVVRSFFGADDSGYLVEKSHGGFSILCGLAQYLRHTVFLNQNESASVCDDLFWQIVQHGLVHPDSLARKRSMYVMKHVLDACCDEKLVLSCLVFSWNPDETAELMGVWQELFLVLEVLEEKQPHVVKPMLAKFASFLERMEASPKVHISWLLLVFNRMLTHESRTVVKWAISKFTSSPALVKLMFDNDMEKFVLGPLVRSLNDCAIFAREDTDPLGSPARLSESLEVFFKHCQDLLSTTDKFGGYLEKLFAALSQQSWNGVSLMYISYALLGLKKQPVLGDSALVSVGAVILDIQRFQEPVLRAAAQCYLLVVCLRLLDPTKVNYHQLSAFLGLFERKEVIMRGSAQWKVAVSALRELLLTEDSAEAGLRPADVTSFLAHSVKDLIEASCPSSMANMTCVCRLARMAVLFHDARLLCGDITWDKLLEGSIEILSASGTRPYLARHHSLRAAQLLIAIYHEAKPVNGDSSLQEELLLLLVPRAEEMHEYIYKLAFLSINSLDDFEETQVHYQFLNILAGEREFNSLSYQFINEGLETCREKLIQSTASAVVSVETVPYWRFLRWVLKRFPRKTNEVEALLLEVIEKGSISRPISRPDSWIIQDRVAKSRWVAFAAAVTELVWESVSKIALSTDKLCNKLIAEAIEALETASQKSCLHILKAVSHALSLVKVVDADLLSKCLKACWQSCKDLKKSDIFRPAVEMFISFAFQPSLLHLYQGRLLSHYLDELLDLGEVMPGVFCTLITKLIDVWKGSVILMDSQLDVMVKALTYGPVYRKDQRIVFDSEAFVTAQGEALSVNQLLRSEHQADVEVRALGIAFLIQLSSSEKTSVQTPAKLSEALVRYDREVTSTRKRYFGNSTIHRIKNRVWQAQLCLLHLLSEEMFEKLLEYVFQELVEDSQQPSIRCLLEWTAVSILLRTPRLRAKLVPAMEQAGIERTGSVCSFLAIIIHLGACLDPETELESHLLEFLPAVLPWSMGQHFNARVYAQVALHLASRWSKEHGLSSVTEKYAALFTCLKSTIQMGNWSRNVEKLLEDFYFKDFNAVDDLTLQTIFCDLPRLTGLTDREFIPLTVFEEVLTVGPEKLALPLYNLDDRLSSAKPSHWLEGTNAEAEVVLDKEDYQKKITPWKQQLASCDLMWDLGVPKKKTGDGLIVVASLIDRIPNLGGLCRTCEVFGVNEFVVGSLKYLEDRNFQGLSVSAEKWITISEVKVHQLKEYLPGKRSEGYTLVGVEQTTGSKPLHEFSFPQKTLLLLGSAAQGESALLPGGMMGEPAWVAIFRLVFGMFVATPLSLIWNLLNSDPAAVAAREAFLSGTLGSSTLSTLPPGGVSTPARSASSGRLCRHRPSSHTDNFDIF